VRNLTALKKIALKEVKRKINRNYAKLLRPSPLAPLPKRERGTRKFLTPLLPFWEKGLGDEGNLNFS
jgi:hypothetical protein